MRRFVSSKVLLLRREIFDDNAAYNGEVYGASGFRVTYPRVLWICDSLEDQNATMIIPWEVDQKVIQRTLPDFLMAMGVSCFK